MGRKTFEEGWSHFSFQGVKPFFLQEVTIMVPGAESRDPKIDAIISAKHEGMFILCGGTEVYRL